MVKKHKKTMIFGGKTYTLKDTAYNKVDAEQIAKSARSKGLSVRINKRSWKSFGYGREPIYGIYVRKKGNCAGKKPTLKSMDIKRTVIQKHGVGIWVYKYKGKFYGTKESAIEESKKSMRR